MRVACDMGVTLWAGTPIATSQISPLPVRSSCPQWNQSRCGHGRCDRGGGRESEPRDKEEPHALRHTTCSPKLKQGGPATRLREQERRGVLPAVRKMFGGGVRLMKRGIKKGQKEEIERERQCRGRQWDCAWRILRGSVVTVWPAGEVCVLKACMDKSPCIAWNEQEFPLSETLCNEEGARCRQSLQGTLPKLVPTGLG